MAKIHKIKRRIRSVTKIQQITSAMERVAASKMRRAQSAAQRSRAYTASAREILDTLMRLTNAQAHPLFVRRDIQRRLLIIFSSDRGLAGSYNTNIIRRVHDALRAAASDAAIPQVIVIGRKGAQQLATLEKQGRAEVIGAYLDWPSVIDATLVQPITAMAIEKFTIQEIDAAFLIYTDFVSGLRQEAVIRQLLPTAQSELLGEQDTPSEALTEARFEPSAEDVLQYLVPRLVGVQLYQAALEAQASEHSMRMVAMKSASDNAGQLLDDLALTYNSARQAAITQELAEISAGVEATR